MLSRVIRRTHMYLALFLFPWMLMYAASTIAMNHRAFFTGNGPAPAFERERELIYDGVFPDTATPEMMARQILLSMDLDGAHSTSQRNDGALVITRADLLAPRRLTYLPADRRLVIEKQPLRTTSVLERFHRRRGYATGYTLDTTWAVTVDGAIVAMLFWVLSGLWMWWEMKATRGFGLIAMLSGAGLFALFLATL